MKRWSFIGGLAIVPLLHLAPTPCFAAASHLDRAVAETRKAVHYGNMPHHESSFAQHIDNAIDQATLAQRAYPHPKIKEALDDLWRGKRIAYNSHSPRLQRMGAAQAAKAAQLLQYVDSARHYGSSDH
ncbi:MAG TPA: hypothetical protein VIF34_02465 [Methylocystis sp.]|jgi:hypothetical protein